MYTPHILSLKFSKLDSFVGDQNVSDLVTEDDEMLAYLRNSYENDVSSTNWVINNEYCTKVEISIHGTLKYVRLSWTEPIVIVFFYI